MTLDVSTDDETDATPKPDVSSDDDIPLAKAVSSDNIASTLSKAASSETVASSIAVKANDGSKKPTENKAAKFPEDPYKPKQCLAIPRDDHGELRLPFDCGSIQLISTGKIVPDDAWHTNIYLFPEGFTTSKYVFFCFQDL